MDYVKIDFYRKHYGGSSICIDFFVDESINNDFRLKDSIIQLVHAIAEKSVIRFSEVAVNTSLDRMLLASMQNHIDIICILTTREVIDTECVNIIKDIAKHKGTVIISANHLSKVATINSNNTKGALADIISRTNKNEYLLGLPAIYGHYPEYNECEIDEGLKAIVFLVAFSSLVLSASPFLPPNDAFDRFFPECSKQANQKNDTKDDSSHKRVFIGLVGLPYEIINRYQGLLENKESQLLDCDSFDSSTIDDDDRKEYMFINTKTDRYKYHIIHKSNCRLIGFINSAGNERNIFTLYSFEETKRTDSMFLPLIAIVSLSHERMKFITQMELTLQLRRRKARVMNTTFNYAGMAFGFDVLDYPLSIEIPRATNGIRAYYAREDLRSYDIGIINIAGSALPSRNGDLLCGMLHEVIFTAVPVDYVVLCVSPIDSISRVRRLMHKMFAHGVTRIMVIVHNTMNTSAYSNGAGPEALYKLDTKKVKVYIEELRKNVALPYEIATINELLEGKVVDDIFDALR